MNTESVLPDGATAVAVRWHGVVDGLHDKLVYGWAIDAERPNSRVVVEVCLDDEPIACIIADVARSDLIEGLTALGATDVCHGFVADLGALPAHSAGVVSARIANTTAQLGGNVRLSQPTTPPEAALNTVIGDGGLRLHGWALDPVDPKRTLTVRAFVGNDMVAQAIANIIHPSTRGYIDGAHGFDLALPASLADGAMHSVRVVDEEGRALNGSPLTICCALDGLAGLLPADADDLLLNVADIYQRHLPRSLPMSAWPEWSARFDRDGPTSLPTLSTAIIVAGDADGAQLERTIASIEAQHGMTVRTFSGQRFTVLLEKALTSDSDVICCVRAGDVLTPHALAYALEGFALPGAKVVYTDSEFEGRPWFKPAWNPDYALASDYPLDLLLVRSDVARELQGVENTAGLAWDALAAVWQEGATSVVHVPRVLVQVLSPLTSEERVARLTAAKRASLAVQPHAVLEELPNAPQGVAYAARRARHPLPEGAREITVSLVIPTRDRVDLLQRCISTIKRFTDWPKLEIIIIDNGSTDNATLAYFKEIEQHGVRVLPMPGPFNYADLNNRAIAQASGEIVGLVNNDIEALHDGWLDEIITQLSRPGVGAVGAKLLWPNGMVQHGGVLLGVGNVAGHFGNRLSGADWGDHGRNQLVQQVSGCTAACLFLNRNFYFELSGMNAEAFPVAFNDVDLCLKIREAGKVIVWTPHANLLHAESASRGHEDTQQKKSRAQREIKKLQDRWGGVLLQDPAYHPSQNLDSQSQAFGGLATPPRVRRARSSNIFQLNKNSIYAQQ